MVEQLRLYLVNLNLHHFICCFIGCLHAISCQRTVHHGGSSIQLSLLYGWHWVHHSRQIKCPWNAKAESIPSLVYWICVCAGLLLYMQSFHANEIAVSSIVHSKYLLSLVMPNYTNHKISLR